MRFVICFNKDNNNNNSLRAYL